MTQSKNYLLQKQLNIMLEHAIKSHLVVPELYAICPICDRPTPQRVSLDEKDDLLRIDYPCVYDDCKEVGE